MIDHEVRFTGSTLETDFLDALFLTGQPELVAAKLNVNFFNRRLMLQFGVTPDRWMRSRMDEEHVGIMASYLRWSAPARLLDGCEPQSLRGISEYIRIRPAIYGCLSLPKHN